MSNLKWFRGEGDGLFKENGHAGQWGLRLGKLLVDNIKIPVAIFNGACGGTTICYYERTVKYKTNFRSNYARLYHRLILTGLQNNVRAILWSQGETDAVRATSTAKYKSEFDTLQKSWAQDYPGFQKIYIFQIRNGSSGPLNNVMAIKEAQRQLAEEYASTIEIIPTSALKQSKDGNHFDYSGGYEQFGNRVYNLIARDIYGIKSSFEINAPMIESAYLSDSTTLIVEEKANYLRLYNEKLPIQNFELENVKSVKIDTIVLNENKIIFKLSKYPGHNFSISYLAQPKNSGNWITNTNDIDLIGFYKYPVNTQIKETKRSIVTKMKISTPPMSNIVKVSLKANGKHYLEIVDNKRKKNRWYTFTGKRYDLPIQGLAEGSYFVRAYNDELNEICEHRIMVSYYLVVK